MGSFLLSGRKLFMHVKMHRLIKDMNDRGSVRVGGLAFDHKSSFNEYWGYQDRSR